MRKNSKDKPRESEFKKFAKKRAPIYLAVAAIAVVFIVPELTKGDLQSSFPEMTDHERLVLETVMEYKGPNGTGLSIMDAIENKIDEEYPNEKIYDNRKTSVDLQFLPADQGLDRVLLNFSSYKGELNYSWDVDVDTGEISANNPKAKHIVDVVDFYD